MDTPWTTRHTTGCGRIIVVSGAYRAEYTRNVTTIAPVPARAPPAPSPRPPPTAPLVTASSPATHASAVSDRGV